MLYNIYMVKKYTYDFVSCYVIEFTVTERQEIYF